MTVKDARREGERSARVASRTTKLRTRRRSELTLTRDDSQLPNPTELLRQRIHTSLDVLGNEADDRRRSIDQNVPTRGRHLVLSTCERERRLLTEFDARDDLGRRAKEEIVRRSLEALQRGSKRNRRRNERTRFASKDSPDTSPLPTSSSPSSGSSATRRRQQQERS